VLGTFGGFYIEGIHVQILREGTIIDYNISLSVSSCAAQAEYFSGIEF
jgi:hypothetical protein